MPFPAEMFSKGRLEYVDQMFGGEEFMAAYEVALAALEQHETVTAVATEARGWSTSLTPDDSAHLTDDFLAWWPHLPVAQVLREGWMHAFSTGRESGKPMEAFWVQGAEEVAMYISEGPHQVTVVMATPPVPESARSNPSDPRMSKVHMKGGHVVHTRLG